MRLCILSAAGLCFVATTLLAQSPAANARHPAPAFLRVVLVYDAETQEPIVGANVTDLLTKNSALTSPTGNVALVPEFVKQTGAMLRITMTGYDTVQAGVVDPLETGVVLIAMSRHAASLPAMVTTEKYRLSADLGKWDGFARRCTVSTVTCFADSVLSANPAAPLSHFLDRTNGVMHDCGAVMNRGARSRRPVGSSGQGGKGIADCVSMRGMGVQANKICQPTYYVDGFVRGSDASTLSDIEEFLGTAEVKGMEVYLSGESMTPRLSPAAGNEGCGVVAIWTK